MTVELFYLVCTSLWLACLWQPYVVGMAMHDRDNIKTNFVTPPDPSRLPSWVQRANRAHLNLVEQFAPFAVLVITLHLLEISNPFTIGASVGFFVLRFLHSLLMLSGYNKFPARPIVFSSAWGCILLLGWQALAQ